MNLFEKEKDKVILYEEQVANLYCDTFDQSPHVIYLLDPTIKYHFKQLQSELNPKLIVDLACGDGKITKILKNLFPESRVIGIDIAPEMIKKAKDKTDPNLKIEYFVYDCSQDLSHILKDADLVTSVFLLNYMSSEDEMINLMKNVRKYLRKGSKFYCGLLNFDLSKNFRHLSEYSKIQPIYPELIDPDNTTEFKKIEKLKLVIEEKNSNPIKKSEFFQYFWDFDYLKEIAFKCNFEEVIQLENIQADDVDKVKYKIFDYCPIFSLLYFK